MKTISKAPRDRDLGPGGIEFDYSVWGPGTRVDFCNVPWDSTYQDVVWYGSDEDAIRSILAQTVDHVTIDGMTYVAQGQPIKVNIPFSRANRFNYLVVRNDKMPILWDQPTVFFYFITSVDYMAPNTTMITVQLDVWQTYCRKVNYGQCFVTQGHIGMAAPNRWADRGQKYLTVPEGLDLGKEYMTPYSTSTKLGIAGAIVVIAGNLFTNHDSRNPNTGIAQGLGGGVWNGCDVLFVPLDKMEQLLHNISNAIPWVGATIQSITMVPNGTVNKGEVKTLDGQPVAYAADDTPAAAKEYTLINDVDEAIKQAIRAVTGTDRYLSLDKLWTSPYCWIEVTTYTGTPVSVAPERLVGKDLTLRQISHVAPPTPRVNFTIRGLGDITASATGGDFLDTMITFGALPTGSVPNNNSLMAQAAISHSIAAGYANADRHRENARDTAQAAWAIANHEATTLRRNTGLSTSLNSTVAANAAEAAQTVDDANRATSTRLGANSVVSDIMSLKMPLADQKLQRDLATKTMLTQNIQMMNDAASRNQALKGTSENDIKHIGSAANTNKAAADNNADRDLQSERASLLAKQQDAAFAPAGVVGQAGGEGLMFTNYQFSIFAKIRIPESGVIKRIGEFWFRFGYLVNQYYTPPTDLCVMSKFTYWKMSEVRITTSVCPQTFRDTIAGILRRGVTVWRNASDIGNIDIATNKPQGANNL